MTTIGNEIISEIKELNKLPPIKYTVDNIKLMYNQVIFHFMYWDKFHCNSKKWLSCKTFICCLLQTVWLYEYFDIGTKMQRVLPFLYKQYQENSFTALEITMKWVCITCYRKSCHFIMELALLQLKWKIRVKVWQAYVNYLDRYFISLFSPIFIYCKKIICQKSKLPVLDRVY